MTVDGNTLSSALRQYAEETPFLELTDKDTVQLTAEGYELMMCMMAVMSLGSKPPINKYAKTLMEGINEEIEQWQSRQN